MKKSIFYFGLLLVTGLLLGGCKSGNKNNAEAVVVEIDRVLEKGDELAGKEVILEGICTHICSHGGGKIFLMGSDDSKTIRIEAGEKIGKFKPETVNNLVQVKGILMENRIDEEYLLKWEEEVKAETAEKHGSGESGCETEKKAQGESVTVSNDMERIAGFRKRIEERKEQDGKAYLSFFYVEAIEYTIK